MALLTAHVDTDTATVAMVAVDGRLLEDDEHACAITACTIVMLTDRHNTALHRIHHMAHWLRRDGHG